MRFGTNDLTRRAVLFHSAVALDGSKLRAVPSCTLTPEQEEGPYYLDAAALRRTLTEGKPGVPLQLRIAAVQLRELLVVID